jgi:hypothetical protein
MRTPKTHPFAVEIHEHSSDRRSGSLIGLQLFETKAEAERYALDNEDKEFSGYCMVRPARSTDKEFA